MSERLTMPIAEESWVRNDNMLDFKLAMRDTWFSWKNNNLLFKNTVAVKSYDQVADIFKPFAKVTEKHREKFPFFVDNLEALDNAVSNGMPIAVEGGPCLFGRDEVTVIVHCKSEQRKFDFVDSNLGRYLKANGSSVTEINFVQHKGALTQQECLQLRYPFEIAGILGGPLVIPLPDMSYHAYLVNVLGTVPDIVRKEAVMTFDTILERIVRLYLSKINSLKREYDPELFFCVHRGTPSFLTVWFSERRAFIDSPKFLKNLTSRPEYLEAVKDYVSMPALPYYLIDAKFILQVDSVDETDSYRKCRKQHKNAFTLGCILLPELLSKDGFTTEYNANRKLKRYEKGEVLGAVKE